jgi:ABC-type multidrug transport system ATPase subunit
VNQQVTDALKYVKLLNVQNSNVETFSGGMKRRLSVACNF